LGDPVNAAGRRDNSEFAPTTAGLKWADGYCGHVRDRVGVTYPLRPS